MIIADLRRFLAEHRRVSLVDLSQRFHSDPDAMRGMLTVLERRGEVRKLPAGTFCSSGCGKCDPASVEIYEWMKVASSR